jgi:serine/threonine-protein kinase
MRDPVTIALAAFAVAGAGLAFNSVTRTPNDAPTIRFTLTHPDGERLPPAGGVHFTVSSDGKVIVYAADRPGAPRQLYVRDIDDHHARPLPGTEGAVQPFFSPDGAWVAYLAEGQLSKIALDGGRIVPLAAITGMNGGSWGPDNLIVVSTRNGLTAVDATGAGVRRISDPDTSASEVRQWHPHVLRDGRFILYTTWSPLVSYRIAIMPVAGGKGTAFDLRGMAPLGIVQGNLVYATLQGDIVAAPFDDGRRRPTGQPIPIIDDLLVSLFDAKATLSPGGTLVYQTGRTDNQVVIRTASSEVRTLLATRRVYGYPRFSPDGKRIALDVGADTASHIGIVDVESGALRLLPGEGTMNQRPEWTPDGERVLFRSNRGAESALWWQYVDRAGPAVPLQRAPGKDILEGIISPDSQYLVYRTGSSGTQVTWTRALRGDTASRRIAAGHAVRWSPDGKWIAYHSSASGRQEVRVRRFPQLDAPLISAPGHGPVWGRDGKHLYYANGSWLMRLTLATTPTFAVLRSDSLFQGDYLYLPGHANFDVSADGRHFLLVKSADRDIHTVVVANWVNELRARRAGIAR